MRKRFFSLILLVAIVTSLVLLTGCLDKKDTGKPEEAIEVTISIDYPKKANKADMETIKFKVEKGFTVMQATTLYASEAEIELLINTTDNTVYGIDTVRNGDFGKNRIWKFQVNDKKLLLDAESVKLKAGDNIRWNYVEQ